MTNSLDYYSEKEFVRMTSWDKFKETKLPPNVSVNSNWVHPPWATPGD